MPLWTILVKWPEPTGPTRAQPRSGAGASVAKIGRKASDHGLVATDHHAVPLIESPHSAAGAAVDVVDASVVEDLCAAQRVLVVGIAAVDEGVAGRQQRQERRDAAVGDGTGRDHEPQRARPRQAGNEHLQRRRGPGAAFLNVLARLRLGVEADHSMRAAHEPLRHVGAHAAQADHSDLHGSPFTACGWMMIVAERGALRWID